MAILDDIQKPYEPVVLSEEEVAAVKPVVAAFVEDETKGLSDDQKRSALPRLLKYVNEAVAYVMANLPMGVERVDGSSIRPLLKNAVDEALALLPEPDVLQEG